MKKTDKAIRIGTRGSRLALYQAELTARLLAAEIPDLRTQIVTIRTEGDNTAERGQDPFETKRVFTREIEAALLDHKVDIAVHSAKDMAVDLPSGLIVGAYLEREDVRDCLLHPAGKKLADLPAGAVIGTSALRRKMQIEHLRPDLKVETIRGNVDTRIRKMTDGAYDAILLAYAGLKRVELTQHISEILDPSVFFPAPGQGAIMIQMRAEDENLLRQIRRINHQETEIRLKTERAFLKELEGGCQLPCGITTKIEDETIYMSGVLFGLTKPVTRVAAESRGFIRQPEASGIALAQKILAGGGREILESIRGLEGGRS